MTGMRRVFRECLLGLANRIGSFCNHAIQGLSDFIQRQQRIEYLQMRAVEYLGMLRGVRNSFAGPGR
jgi:hypothetical protein